MGQLNYGERPLTIEVDDRVLAHLQMVILAKFRRDESFAFTVDIPADGGSGRSVLWLTPNIPVQFRFWGNKMPEMSRAWVEELMLAANSSEGLRIVAEPQ